MRFFGQRHARCFYRCFPYTLSYKGLTRVDTQDAFPLAGSLARK